jgi:hypothetical protein
MTAQARVEYVSNFASQSARRIEALDARERRRSWTGSKGEPITEEAIP